MRTKKYPTSSHRSTGLKKQPPETHRKRKPLQTPPRLGSHCAPFLYADCEQTGQAGMLTGAWLEPFSSSKPRKQTTTLLLIQMDTCGPTSLKKTQHWDSLASPAVLGPVWAPSAAETRGRRGMKEEHTASPPRGGVCQAGEAGGLASPHSIPLHSLSKQTHLQWFSKRGPWTHSFSINWGLVRNADSQALAQTYLISNSADSTQQRERV